MQLNENRWATQQEKQELVDVVHSMAKEMMEATGHLLDESVPLATRERDYQLLLIALDKGGIRPLNRSSPELLKYFPEYANQSKTSKTSR